MCADLVEKCEVLLGQSGTISSADAKTRRIRLEIELLEAKAELAWRAEGGDAQHNAQRDAQHDGDGATDAQGDSAAEEAIALAECALMQAQEHAVADAEARCCLRLGRWHAEAEAGAEEACVYLRQVDIIF